MVSRDRVIRTLNHQSTDRAPRDLWLPAGMELERPDDVAEINIRFPSDFLHLETCPHAAKRGKAQSLKAATYIDGWGCTWKIPAPDGTTILAASPLASPAAVTGFRPPAELLEPARLAKINPVCDGTARFTLAASEMRPVERLCQLRGPEIALRELGEGNLELRDLLVKLHDHFCREAELWASTHVDGVVLGDDMTWPSDSRSNLKLWRSIIKPLLRDYCAILHRHDKFVFFRAQGAVGEALEDLVEIGVDALHAQWPLDEFVKRVACYCGKLTCWGGVENRRLETPHQVSDVRDAVFRVRKAADLGAGGIISQINWGSNVPLRNIATFFEQWLVPLPVTV